MKKNVMYIAMIAMFAGLIMTGCGSSKKASKGYSANQTKPSTEQQAEAANRGLKLAKEECED
ncbi:MAG: hypothetical protein LBF59_07035, partial [Prevotellaceae bacterium]|nr:hypothetical protein [Prevotellaceae bacterium]